MPAGIGSLWPAEVGTRWTRHDWGRGDGRGEESGTHRRDRLRCSIYAHAARYSGAARHPYPNSLPGWHSRLHNILFLPNKDINMIRWVLAQRYIRKSVFQLTWFDIADVTFRRFLLLIQLWNRLGNRLASFFRLLSYVPPFFSISGWISWRKLKCSFPDVNKSLQVPSIWIRIESQHEHTSVLSLLRNC